MKVGKRKKALWCGNVTTRKERRSDAKRQTANDRFTDVERFAVDGPNYAVAVSSAYSVAKTKVPITERIIRGGYNSVTYAQRKRERILPFTRTK